PWNQHLPEMCGVPHSLPLSIFVCCSVFIIAHLWFQLFSRALLLCFTLSFYEWERCARLRRAVPQRRDCRCVELRALCNDSPQTPPGPEGSNGSGSASCAAEDPKFLSLSFSDSPLSYHVIARKWRPQS